MDKIEKLLETMYDLEDMTIEQLVDYIIFLDLMFGKTDYNYILVNEKERVKKELDRRAK